MLATKLPFSNGGITQPFTFHGLISFFLVPGAPFHAIRFLHILIQPFCLPTSAKTNACIHRVLCYNLWLLNEPQNHHQPLFLLPPDRVCDPCMLQNPLPQTVVLIALPFWL